MERFKAIMKRALSQKAIRIKVEAGKHAHIVTAKGPDELRDLPVVDEGLLKLLYQTFFHKDQEAIAAGKPTKGQLLIAGFDKLKLIAEPRLQTLKIFVPPEGEPMFASAWETIENSRPAGAGTVTPGMDMFGAPAVTPSRDVPLSEAAPSPVMAPPAFTPAFEPEISAVPLAAMPPPEPAAMMAAPAPAAMDMSKMFAMGGGEADGDLGGISYTPLDPDQLDNGIPKAIGPDSVDPAAALLGTPVVPEGMGLDFNALSAPPVAAPAKAPAAPEIGGLDFNAGFAAAPAAAPAAPKAAPTVAPDFLAEAVAPARPRAPEPVAPAPGAPAMAPATAFVPPVQAVPTVAPAATMAPAPAAPRPAPAPAAARPAPAPAPAHAHGGGKDDEGELPPIPFGAHIPGSTIARNGDFPIDAVLRDMVQRKASDLHLTPGEPICMRIDGDIVRIPSDPLSASTMERLILPIMPPVNHKEFATINDTDFAYELPGVARFRVNVYRDLGGVGAVLRQIPSTVLSAKQLNLPPAIRKFCELSKGLVVVTGPTGSGKSTTLAGMIDLINETRNDHILTIEDPVEFVHKQKSCLINQREIHRHTTSFKRALKAALREDPDIVLIGEMRDLETIAIAIETAETGHLVFGTLHTNTAVSTVDRIIDQFPSNQQMQIRVMLAESLKGVVAQTLLKKKGGGRVAAHEILVCNKAVSSLIREGKTHMIQNIMQTQKADGNQLLNETLFNLVVQGVVDARDAYMKAVEKEPLLQMFATKGIRLPVSEAS